MGGDGKVDKEAIHTNVLGVREYNAFFNCNEKGRPINEYHLEFTKLLRYVANMTSKYILDKFIVGLDEPLASQVENLQPKSLTELLNRLR